MKIENASLYKRTEEKIRLAKLFLLQKPYIHRDTQVVGISFNGVFIRMKNHSIEWPEFDRGDYISIKHGLNWRKSHV